VREYELVYILHPDITPEREAEIHAKLDRHIQGTDAHLLLRDDWGKRKLSYEIDKLQKGHYFLLSFLGTGEMVGPMERELRIDQDVIRFLTILRSPLVKDIEGRLTKAKAGQVEQERRREQREREAVERAEREKRMSEEQRTAGGAPHDDDDNNGSEPRFGRAAADEDE
jgi:small subunit ribosomal protein S6